MRSGCNSPASHPSDRVLFGWGADHKAPPLALQESCAILSYVIARYLYGMFCESLLAPLSFSQQRVSYNATCETLCC